MIFRFRKYNERKWHLSFALLPVKTLNDEFVWLQSVERKWNEHPEPYIGPNGWFDYRLPGTEWETSRKDLRAEIDRVREAISENPGDFGLVVTLSYLTRTLAKMEAS